MRVGSLEVGARHAAVAIAALGKRAAVAPGVDHAAALVRSRDRQGCMEGLEQAGIKRAGVITCHVQRRRGKQGRGWPLGGGRRARVLVRSGARARARMRRAKRQIRLDRSLAAGALLRAP